MCRLVLIAPAVHLSAWLAGCQLPEHRTATCVSVPSQHKPMPIYLYILYII
jgi:hypothetical protein